MFNKTGNINHTVNIRATVVQIVHMSVCIKFGSKRTNFLKVIVEQPMDPSSRTRDRLPSVLNLRGLWPRAKYNHSSRLSSGRWLWSLLHSHSRLCSAGRLAEADLVRMHIGYDGGWYCQLALTIVSQFVYRLCHSRNICSLNLPRTVGHIETLHTTLVCIPRSQTYDTAPCC